MPCHEGRPSELDRALRESLAPLRDARPSGRVRRRLADALREERRRSLSAPWTQRWLALATATAGTFDRSAWAAARVAFWSAAF